MIKHSSVLFLASYLKEIQMDKKPVYSLLGICLASVAIHYYIYSENKVERLESIVEYSDRASEMVGTRNYVSGVVETLSRPEHYEQIWHDGYDRGTEVQIMASKVEKKIELVNEKETK